MAKNAEENPSYFLDIPFVLHLLTSIYAGTAPRKDFSVKWSSPFSGPVQNMLWCLLEMNFSLLSSKQKKIEGRKSNKKKKLLISIRSLQQLDRLHEKYSFLYLYPLLYSGNTARADLSCLYCSALRTDCSTTLWQLDTYSFQKDSNSGALPTACVEHEQESLGS